MSSFAIMVLIFLLYTYIEDERLIENKCCLEWLHMWETQVKSADGISLKEKSKMFLSNKTMFDVCSMIMGFEAYCDILFKMYPGSSVSACYTNQDKLENFFGKQRAHNGAPLIQQFCKQVRTIYVYSHGYYRLVYTKKFQIIYTKTFHLLIIQVFGNIFVIYVSF